MTFAMVMSTAFQASLLMHLAVNHWLESDSLVFFAVGLRNTPVHKVEVFVCFSR